MQNTLTDKNLPINTLMEEVKPLVMAKKTLNGLVYQN